MHAEDLDDFPESPRGRPRGKSLDDRQVSVKRIQQDVAWIHQPLVYWTGTMPDCEVYLGSAFRPVRHLIARRLSGLPPGIYAVELGFLTLNAPWKEDTRKTSRCVNLGIREVRPIRNEEISTAARALRRGLRFPKALGALVGNVEKWSQEGEADLFRVSCALKALSLPRPLSIESLALEERCWWIGSRGSRPSLHISSDTLQTYVTAHHPQPTPGGLLACVLLGQRRVAAPTLPTEYRSLFQLASQLPAWTPELLTSLCGDPQHRTLLSSLAQQQIPRDWNSSAAASLVEEFLWAGGSTSLRELLQCLSPCLEAIARLKALASIRFTQLLGILDQTDHQGSLCKPLPDQRWLAPWEGFNRLLIEKLRERTDQAATFPESLRKGWNAMDRLFQSQLGVPLDKTKQPIRPFHASSAEEAKQKFLRGLHQDFQRAIQPSRPGWSCSLSGVAGRISGRINHNALVPILQFLNHLSEIALPGRHGDDPLRVAQHLLEFWIGAATDRPEDLKNLLSLVARQANLLLQQTTGEFSPRLPLRGMLLRLRLEGWALGRLGALDPSIAEGLIKAQLIGSAADLIQTHPQRLRIFAEHLLSLEEGRTETQHLQLWVDLFTEKRESTLRWGLQIYDRLLMTASGNVSMALSMLNYVLRCLGANDDLERFITAGTSRVERVADAVSKRLETLRKLHPFGSGANATQLFLRRLFVLKTAEAWHRHGHQDPDGLVQFLLEKCESHENKQDDPSDFGIFQIRWFQVSPNGPVLLSQGSTTLLWKLLIHPVSDTHPWSQVESGWSLLRTESTAREFLVNCLESEKHLARVLRLTARLGLVSRLHVHEPLKSELITWNAPAAEALGPELDWLAKTPLAPCMQLLSAYRRSMGETTRWPKTIQHILDRPKLLEREWKHLCGLISSGVQHPKLLKRQSSLRSKLDHPDQLEAWMLKDLEKHLEEQLLMSRLTALEQCVERSIQGHWKRVIGADVPTPLTNDWDNALRLLEVISSNKVLLKRLLREESLGNRNWNRSHSENRKWVQRISRTNALVETWLGPFDWTCRVRGSTWRIYVEQDPLKVLQMGNLFDTCLSTGSINDFAVVANAVELNKRVLFLRDQSGTILGRKLITLLEGENGVLLGGFRSYGAGELETLASKEGSVDPWIKILFDVMCGKIARRIHVALARCPDHSTQNHLGGKARLFAAWYNDGLEAFDDWILSEEVWPTDQAEPRSDRLLDYTHRELQNKTSAYHRTSLLRALLWLGRDAQPFLDSHGSQLLSQEERAFLTLHHDASARHSFRTAPSIGRRDKKIRPSARS